MKKSIILIGILLAVVIAMVGYYFMNKKQEGFQDQPEFEEIDTPLLDGKTEYIIKLTGVGTENNGIVRYLSSSGDDDASSYDDMLSEEINGTLFKFHRTANNWFEIKRNDSKNLKLLHTTTTFFGGETTVLLLLYSDSTKEEDKSTKTLIREFTINDGGLVTSENKSSPYFYFLLAKDENNNDILVLEIVEENTDSEKINKYKTEISFIKAVKTRPAQPSQTTTAAPSQTTTAAPAQTTTAAPKQQPTQQPAQTTPTTPPATGTTTQALLGAEMGVKSKVKMTPDIRDYINSELNKYTDGSSLPTPEQIEQLSKIVGNHTAEELAKIPNLLNNFKDNTQSYMDFHKSYEEQLEEILRTKFDAERGANQEIQERNSKRLARLREEVRKYADITATTTSASANNSLQSGSLRNIGNGTMLNFDKITGSDTDSNYVVLNMKGEKMVRQSDGSYKGDEQGEIQGCLTFDSLNKKLGTPALTPCNIDNNQSRELSFNVRKIENIKEYNKLLTETAPETKSLASEYDTINYPFHVVEPQNLSGFCVSVDDNKVRVLPCEKNSNQRYRKMHYQVKNQCGQNNNGNQS